ncbi:(Fe-S)-binding protein [Arenimonas oryziterrae]|nr:(Fe-S)-binding protein [Arenimonas oryziterrae]
MTDRCVQCGLCLPHCPTYRLDGSEAESPRGRIAYIQAVTTGLIEPSPVGDEHLDHCLGCRRCEAVCPAGVEYGELLTLARVAQRRRRPLPLPDRVHLALLARPGWLEALLRLQAGLVPDRWRRLPSLPPRQPMPATTGTETAAIFVGCVADGYESATRAALARLLAGVGVVAVVPEGQTCCGTAARHAGLREDAEALAARNRQAFSGQTRLLTLASGCHEQVQSSLAGIGQIEDALSFLASRAERLAFRTADRRVALHVPCSQRLIRSDLALRQLLARIPGLDLVELDDTGCCGAAGLHMLSEPERAAALRAPLLQSLARSGASELLSANIGCRLHLGGASPIPVRHPLDFLAEHLA